MPGDTGVFLEILEYRNVDKTPVDTRTANPGTAHLAFFTDDCDALYEELVAKGVDVGQPAGHARPSAPTRAAGRCT